MTEQTMKRGIAVFEAMNDLPASVLLRAALPEDGENKPREARASLWDRINTNAWVAAAIGLVVALGVITLIVLAGRGAGGPGVAGTSSPVIPEHASYAFVFEDQVAIPVEGMFWEHGNIGRVHEYEADGAGLSFKLTDSDDPPTITLRAEDAAGLQFICRTRERVGIVWLWDAGQRMIEQDSANDFSNLPELLSGKPGVYYVGVSIYRETGKTRGEYCECIRLVVQSGSDDPAQTEGKATEESVLDHESMCRSEVFTGEDNVEKLDGDYYLILQDNEDEKIPVDCYLFDGTRKQFVIPLVQTLQQLGAEIKIKREWDTIEIRWEGYIAVLDFYNEVLYDYYKVADSSSFNEQIHKYTWLRLGEGEGRLWLYERFDWENQEVYINDEVFQSVLLRFGVLWRTTQSTEFGDHSGVKRITVNESK